MSESNNERAIHSIWAISALVALAGILFASIRGCEQTCAVDKVAIEHGYIRAGNAGWVAPMKPNESASTTQPQEQPK